MVAVRGGHHRARQAPQSIVRAPGSLTFPVAAGWRRGCTMLGASWLGLGGMARRLLAWLMGLGKLRGVLLDVTLVLLLPDGNGVTVRVTAAVGPLHARQDWCSCRLSGIAPRSLSKREVGFSGPSGSA